MKYLYLLRHAKSDRSAYPRISDFERGLNKRGKESIRLVGSYLEEKGIALEHIVSSSAIRAKKTAKKICSYVGCDKQDIVFTESLYEATPTQIQTVIEGVDDRYSSLLLVGHNPGLGDFVEQIDGSVGHLPTCAFIAISCDINSWSHFDSVLCRVTWYIFPKMLS